MSNNIYNFANNPSMPEKVLSALAYLTFGTLGIVLLIASGIMKTGLKPFVKFNVYQSILCGVIFFVLQITYDLIDGIFQFLQIIPFLGKLLYSIFQFFVYYLMSFPILFGFSLLSSAIILLILYLSIYTIIGKMPYIPVISPSIKRFI